MVYKFFDKKLTAGSNTLGGAVTRANKSAIKSKIVSNRQLAEELHKHIIKKFENRRYTHHIKTIFEVLI